MKVADLVTDVAFGTSGARGLSEKITDLVAYSYTCAFLQYLNLPENKRNMAVAGDLRPSTPRIKNAVMEAASDCGYAVIDAGFIPSPAVALYGFKNNMPTIMVTGSHIPADRNGIKFTKQNGEISKEDEQGILSQDINIPQGLFDDKGNIQREKREFARTDEAARMYVDRFIKAFPANLLAGHRIGVYEHSAVGRDLMVEIISRLGGEAVSLARSDDFIPVDTEAIRPEDCQLAKEWCASGDFDAIISTDGDSDRPLISDETGQWFRGDIVGILTAQFLQAQTVVLPVSCNTAIDEIGFKKVYRTKIGSPYVIAAMEQAEKDGCERIVGYEANGGFLQYSHLETEHGELEPLPTRDPMIVHLSVLSLALKMEEPVSTLREILPARFTASDRIKEFPTVRSKAILAELSVASGGRYLELEKAFSSICGGIKDVNFTDGVRITFMDDEIIHLRPSGNAPEFRCYTEASSQERAEEILKGVLAKLVLLK